MLVAQEVALEMIYLAKPITDAVARKDKNLADQMRRAAQSVVLNIAEGAFSRGGNELARFASALGSANEMKAAISVAVAWGYVDKSFVNQCNSKLEKVSRLLWGLVYRRNYKI